MIQSRLLSVSLTLLPDLHLRLLRRLLRLQLLLPPMYAMDNPIWQDAYSARQMGWVGVATKFAPLAIPAMILLLPQLRLRLLNHHAMVSGCRILI